MTNNENPNEESCLSQEKKILAYLQTGAHINPGDARLYFGCDRLAARIADIRKKGYEIKDEFIKLRSGKRVKSYWIPKG